MRHATFVFASVALSLFTTLASAGGSTADQAIAPPSPDKVGARPEQAADEHKRVAVVLNPLGVLIGRYSLQGEYLPAKHHSITLSPFYTHVPVKAELAGQTIDGGSLSGFGGELGYRFYTGDTGPSGFFVGPSVLFASYSQSAATGFEASGSLGSNSFTSVGGAVDVGGQAVVGPGIVVGGGFGLQYTKTSRDIDTENINIASAIIASGGVRPRFLFSVGYAF